MRSLITPFITRYWSSERFRQKRQLKALKQPDSHIAQVFIALDDPYSYLLLRGLQTIQNQYDITFSIHIIQNREADMFPEPKMWKAWAKKDANLLAELYEFSIPDLTEDMDIQLSKVSKFVHSDTTSIDLAIELFESSDNISITDEARQSAKSHIQKDEALLQDLGHYLPATVYYMGEFFWGLDRISHFESLLIKQNKNTSDHRDIIFDRTYKDFCQESTNSIQDHETPVVLYFSMRSPYSHLALNRCYELCQHYNIPLEIKPVLPMLMRGLPVPKNKTQYIFFDTLRESKKLGIDYGNVADPIGSGVRNCYAIWMLAKEKGLGNEFMLCFSNAVNSKGLSGNYQYGLKRICKEVGLSWNEAKKVLIDTSWEEITDNNLKEMYEHGIWGVPALKYKDTCVWGQDRIWKIEQTLLNESTDQSKAHS